MGQRTDNVKTSILHHGAEDRFKHLGQDAIARRRRSRALREWESDLAGQVGEPRRAAPGRPKAREVAGGCLGPEFKSCSGNREVPGGISQEFQSLAGGSRFRAEGEVPRAEGLAEERWIPKPVLEESLEGQDGGVERGGRIPGVFHGCAA